MSQQRHARAKELFLSACERPPDQRQEFLEQACGDDEALRQEIVSLLAHHSDAGGAGSAPTTIGNYLVIQKIGQGGMGEVYRAQDPKLGREVAIKVLPEAFAQDPEWRARFDREARLLASLNHANIATLHGVEEAGGVHFLVMELVPGATLAERILEGRLSIEEALPLFRQIAEALEAAHERGVIHRDLKPENIKVTPAGQVKVLDFSLAKALGADVGGDVQSASPTVVRKGTDTGMILGTAPYMSPEQARGKSVDKRTDIWSFGCVLYEALTAQAPFLGETISDTIAKILDREPDWQALPKRTPARIRELIERCLRKDSKKRLQDIGTARQYIEESLGDRLGEASGVPVSGSRAPFVLAGGFVLGALLAGMAVWNLRSDPPEAPLRKFVIPAELDAIRDQAPPSPPVISPDGTKIVYSSEDQLWIRELDELEPRVIRASERATHPFWSPDSNFVGFIAGGAMWKAPAGGGETTVILVLEEGLLEAGSATWGPDDTIVFSTGRSVLYEVSARGGDPRTLLLEEGQHVWKPSFLPDGRGLLFVLEERGAGWPDRLVLISDGNRKDLLRIEGQALIRAVYSRTGHILYERARTNPGVWAVPFSLSTLELTGEPFLVVPDGGLQSISSDGTLAYVHRSRPLSRLVWVDREGSLVGTVGEPQLDLRTPSLSPDGRRVAVSALEGDSQDVWIHDLVQGTRTRLTFGDLWLDAVGRSPTWLTPGDRVGFTASPAHIAIKSADGTGEAEILTPGIRPAISRDGRYLVYILRDEAGWGDIWYLRLDQAGEPTLLFKSPVHEVGVAISPDARHLAYVSDESGRLEIYVTRFPSGEGKWQASVNGGGWQRWGRRGDKLFYEENNTLMEVDVTTEPTLALGTPRALFSADTIDVTLDRGYTVGPDDDRFLVVQELKPEGATSGITVVENWFAEFKEEP